MRIFTVPCPHFACGGEIEAVAEDGAVSLLGRTCSEGWEITDEEAADIEADETPNWFGGSPTTLPVTGAT